MSAFLLVALAVALAGACRMVWESRFRKVPLAEFGIESVQRVLRFEHQDYRETVWKRGWMTSHEWTVLNKKQIAEISAEIKRRGLE